MADQWSKTGARIKSYLIPAVQSNDRASLLEPAGDALLRRLQLIVDPAQRIQAHRDLLQAETGDMAFMPLYWEMQVSYRARGVIPSPGGLQTLTNFFACLRI